MDEHRPCDLANHKLSPCSENVPHVSLNYRQHVMTGDQYDTISVSVSISYHFYIILYSGKRSINQKACPFSNKMDFMMLSVSFD